MWLAHEAPADGERCRRPLNSLPRVGILAGGEFDEEAADELVGAGALAGAEIAAGAICGLAAQSHLPAPQSQREHEARPWCDPAFAVSLDQEIPTVGAEFDAVVSDAADPGSTAPVVEPQLAGGAVELAHERIGENPAEGSGQPRHNDAHLERRALGRIQDAVGDRLVRSR